MLCSTIKAMRTLPAAPLFALVLILVVQALSIAHAREGICVVDDSDRRVCLSEPAQRIIALSPGTTELLFSAGAGERIVGTVTHSDYPEAAKTIPRVGSYERLDLEAMIALEPDLIIAWNSGNPAEPLRKLERLEIALYRSEPRRFHDIATTLTRLGRLAGTSETATGAARDFRNEIATLRRRYSESEPVRVFYQVWPDPLMTVNNEHLIGRTLKLCGGRNIFGALDRLTPRIDKAAVLERNPEVIVTGGRGKEDASWLEPWRQYKHLRAVQRNNLFFVPPSKIQRHTPRLAEGARILCEKLEVARAHRG